MTARYRCPFCGSFSGRNAMLTRQHIMRRHRMRLIEGLGIIEAFGTRNTVDPPRNVLKRYSRLDSGDPGDGNQEEGR